MKIIFYGTPEFAVPSLDRLVKDNCTIAAVVTAPDKPSGRGQKLSVSAVKEYALKNNLKVLQPTNLKDESFLQELKDLNPDLQIVVAFRMMPESVWKLPRLGTFNLHASLLPQYRGAAPINWAIINGEKETGVTTFFLRHEIDTGSIIMQEKIVIDDDDTAGSLHDKLMNIGAGLVVKTVHAIEHGNYNLTEQDKFVKAPLKAAPKLNKQNTRIDINKGPDELRNFIRGLSPYPTAHGELYSPSMHITLILKIYSVRVDHIKLKNPPGSIETDHKTYIKVFVNGGSIYLEEIQVSGRNKMNVRDFLNGFKMDGEWLMQ